MKSSFDGGTEGQVDKKRRKNVSNSGTYFESESPKVLIARVALS